MFRRNMINSRHLSPPHQHEVDRFVRGSSIRTSTGVALRDFVYLNMKCIHCLTSSSRQKFDERRLRHLAGMFCLRQLFSKCLSVRNLKLKMDEKSDSAKSANSRLMHWLIVYASCNHRFVSEYPSVQVDIGSEAG